jgi:hypothetical protein
MYLGLLYFALLLLIFLLNRFLLDEVRTTGLNKVLMYISLFYSVFLFILFFVRGVTAGYYHDEHGTAPSDMEKMFNYFHILYIFIPFIFAYLFDKKE